MEKVEIISAGNCKYIGEFLNELPKDSMLNKVSVGSGATSVALKDKEKLVLCVPFVSLIHNKIEWCKKNNIDAIPIYYDQETQFNTVDYLQNFKGDKIIVTYDSIDRVVECINPAEWKIVIDEAHKLIDSGSFRGKAVRKVIENFRKFKSYCFITATPVPDKYQHPELIEIQKYRIKWNNLSPVNIKYMPIEKQLYQTASIIALNHLKGVKTGNAHIFINSVNGIIDIIRHLNKSRENIKDNVRIVCADNDRNNNLLELKLGSDYSRSENTTAAKKINFYTSTSFEGSDIFDTEGVSYIVTDGSKDYTKIDILTTLPQIAGRIRDSKYKNDITLVYTPNNYYSHTTEEEFELFVKSELERFGLTVKAFQEAEKIGDSATKEILIKGSYQSIYLFAEDGILKLNTEALYNEMFNYSTIHSTYYIIDGDSDGTFKEKQTEHNSITYNYIPEATPEIKGLNKLNLGKTPNFKDLCLEYIKLRGTNWDTESPKIAKAYPIIKEAFEILGSEKMQALKYRQKDIQKELIIQDKIKGFESKIVQLLGYKSGQWLSNQTIKADLERVYSDLNISKTPKATDLNGFYTITENVKKVKGLTYKGYVIINAILK